MREYPFPVLFLKVAIKLGNNTFDQSRFAHRRKAAATAEHGRHYFRPLRSEVI